MKTIKQQGNEFAHVVVFFGIGLGMGLVLLISLARFTWHSKFYPGVEIAGIPVSGLTREQAKNKLQDITTNYQAKFEFNGSSWTAPKDAVEFEIEPTLNEAYRYGRKLALSDYLLLLINKKTNYPIKLAEGQTEKMQILISEMSGAIEIPPIEPTISVVGKTINIVNGESGLLIDKSNLDNQILENYRRLEKNPISVPTISVDPTLTSDKMIELRSRAETLVDKNLTLTLDDENIKIGTNDIVAFLSTTSDVDILNKLVIVDYVSGLGDSLNKNPQEAKFEFNSGVVKEFLPGKDGVSVNTEMTSEKLQLAITKLIESESKSENIEIVATRTPPKVTTEKVNELGIKERIGRGESYYAHSIPNRIYNVGLAAERANSALIAPGEEFSFNKIVGEISGATGYRAAYVISGGRTVLGDGGGVCQVSTTLFRGAMNAGLPITERWAHAYRVGYYEQNSEPGIDATVYAPSKDLRFLNDTPGHILVQTINDPKTLHLIVEIYGTSDGRVATVTKPKVWGNTPPLPTIYQDDPTMPSGSTKQVDWSAAGAKASFEYKVTKNGETIQEKTFSSIYRPWASVYLRGTGL